jgi:hypothetical protein
MQNFMSKHPYPPYQCCVTPWTYNTLHTTLKGGKGVAILVIDMGVKFRTVSVKCANIFDQDCPNIKMKLKFMYIYNVDSECTEALFTCFLRILGGVF